MAWEEWQFSNNKTHSHQSDAKGWKIFMSTLLNWLRCKKSHSKRPSPVKVADGRSDSLLPTKSLNRARTLREYHFNQRFISFVFINYSFFKLRWRLRAPSSIRSSRLPSKCLQRQKDRHYYLSSHSFEEKKPSKVGNLHQFEVVEFKVLRRQTSDGVVHQQSVRNQKIIKIMSA